MTVDGCRQSWLLVLGWYLSYSAARLDRLHARV
jgi:hypothetical protein